MKRKLLLIISIFFSIYSYSQENVKNDVAEIIKIIINKYETNNQNLVFYKFINDKILSDFQYIYFDTISNKKIDNIILKDYIFNYDSNYSILKKNNLKKLKKIVRINYKKTYSLHPKLYISYPIFSINNKIAIVYSSYLCGPLCEIESFGLLCRKKPITLTFFLKFIQ